MCKSIKHDVLRLSVNMVPIIFFGLSVPVFAGYRSNTFEPMPYVWGSYSQLSAGIGLSDSGNMSSSDVHGEFTAKATELGVPAKPTGDQNKHEAAAIIDDARGMWGPFAEVALVRDNKNAIVWMPKEYRVVAGKPGKEGLPTIEAIRWEKGSDGLMIMNQYSVSEDARWSGWWQWKVQPKSRVLRRTYTDRGPYAEFGTLDDGDLVGSYMSYQGGGERMPYGTFTRDGNALDFVQKDKAGAVKWHLRMEEVPLGSYQNVASRFAVKPQGGGGFLATLAQLGGAAAGMALTNGSTAGAMAGASLFATTDEERQALLKGADHALEQSWTYGSPMPDGGYYVGNGLSSKEVAAFQARERGSGTDRSTGVTSNLAKHEADYDRRHAEDGSVQGAATPQRKSDPDTPIKVRMFGHLVKPWMLTTANGERVPTDGMCYSNMFTIARPAGWKRLSDAEREQFFQSYTGAFINRCSSVAAVRTTSGGILVEWEDDPNNHRLDTIQPNLESHGFTVNMP